MKLICQTNGSTSVKAASDSDTVTYPFVRYRQIHTYVLCYACYILYYILSI